MSCTELQTAASERIRQLPRCLDAHQGFVDVPQVLLQGGSATLDGVWGSSCALIAARLADTCPQVLVVVCPHHGDVDDFCEDFTLFSPGRVERFPAWESDPGERIIHDEIYGDRLRTLKQLASQHGPPVIVTSIQSLLQPVPSRGVVAESTQLLKTGDAVDVEQLLRWLAEHRFHHTSAVELPGEFAARGGIVDIFAPDWDQPVRIELFDDQVESIRCFDVASQRSLSGLAQVEITVLEPGRAASSHFASYLPDNSWVMLLEPEQLSQQGQQYLARLEHPQQFHSVAAAIQSLDACATVTAASIARGALGATCRLQIESVERFSGEIGRVRSELDRVGQGHEVHVVAQTEAEVQRLSEIFQSTQLAESGQLHFPVGNLRSGFRLVQDRVILISGNELFARGQLHRLPRRRLGKAIRTFLDLREGDLVVHLAHGIGRYRGLQLLDKDQQVEEHLEIEFHGGTKVFVPASKIDLVQKYVGASKSRPALAKIGGKTWIRQKQAAQSAVLDMAAEMLQLQAERMSRPGIHFGSATEWEHEFDASFPYQETPDQLAAMEEIKSDMVTARPMDRLLCGDVGYGKTELAMRAAFKAVDSGYQVAILVPTTILAEQHFQTFSQRMAEFPFDIAKLSRFCTASQQRETLDGLATGRIDVVVGTHRLASKDVGFHNLGLVIIDEEQRFGVEVKERLKTLRTTVDILTMTATPIPRTLHMSLVGVRDISNLETPPEDRIAVETRVTRFNQELIRHAVLRELNRGGQIYFVHNRVQDIHQVEQKLRSMVPEAKIAIAHGQMPEHDLERVMVDFVAQRFDLLLATTIVESGLDIPNANTIFVDEADRYGLADLHQLRGRVGRYKHRAYCYLLIDPHKHITPNAAKRLRAIEEFSDMGAGFSIAMRDLEIRGAGNLLGTQQSGHIAAVGYELYCQLLENAVRTLKHQPPKLSLDVDLDLPGQSYLPPDYVDHMRLKIDLYRRLSQMVSFEQLDQFEAELSDRFGTPPSPVRRMLALARLKIEAAVWQIAAIFIEGQYLVFRYTHRLRMEQLARRNRGRLRIVDDQCAYLTLPQEVSAPDEILHLVKSVLRPE